MSADRLGPVSDASDESGANLPQATCPGKEFCRAHSWQHVARSADIGHQIAMKSDKKDTSGSAAAGGKSDRLEREAAALRANLRRRKQQQQAKRTQDRLEEGPKDKDGS